MMEILDQMGWDDDHQYAIYCSYAGTTKNTRLRNSVVFTTSPMDENELTSRKKLSSVDWDGIKHIFVNYDFGDDHWFECKITNIIDDDTNKIVVVDPIKETFDQYR
jgi:hypothetical protein